MSSAIGGGKAVTALAGAVTLAINAYIAEFLVDDPCLLFESAVAVVRANGRAAFAGCNAEFGPADSSARASAPLIGPSCSRQFSAPSPAVVAPRLVRAPVLAGVIPPGVVAPLRPPAARGGGRPVLGTAGAARRAVGAVSTAGSPRGGVLLGDAAPPPLPASPPRPRPAATLPPFASWADRLRRDRRPSPPSRGSAPSSSAASGARPAVASLAAVDG